MHLHRLLLTISSSAALALSCTGTASEDSTQDSTGAGSGTGTASSAATSAEGSSEAEDSSSSEAGVTSADTTTSSTTAEPTESDGSGGFVQVDMLGNAMCDIWSEGDCGEGEKCMPFASEGGTWDALKCVPVEENAKVLGDDCFAELGPAGGIDDCAEGLFCYYVDNETNEGTCIEFCTGSPQAPMCNDGAICTIVNDGVLVLCRPECDPVSQDCEPAGSGCYQATGTGSFTCIADKSGPMGGYGDGCELISTCDPGLACLEASAVPGCTSGSCCTNFCDVNDPNTCPDADQGQICQPYYDAPDVGYEHVGICAVPQPKVEGGKLSVGSQRVPSREAALNPL